MTDNDHICRFLERWCAIHLPSSDHCWTNVHNR